MASKISKFVTSPIFYANAEPHIGHAYTAILCDTAHRWNFLKSPGQNHKFSIGTDEHGSKIYKAAEKAGIPPKQFCDQVSHKFSALFENLEISNTNFIRTTDKDHMSAVEHFWGKLQQNGHIFKSKYAGFYSISDECFVPEQDVEKCDGGRSYKMKNTRQPVEWIEEENYMFRLSDFREKVEQWITSSDVVMPSKYRSLALDSLSMEEDLSISRSRSRLSWGIPVPGDPSQTIYVWMDALVNYLTVAGYPNTEVWPPSCQVIGKDITKFHLYYWPSFLMAAGLPLPEKVFIHGHWLVDNVKMSKSVGNVIDPNELINKFTAEGFRYFLLKHGNPGSDCSFSWNSCLESINSDMVNNIGNILNRSTVEKINKDKKYPKIAEIDGKTENSEELVKMLGEISEKSVGLYEKMQYYKVIEELILVMKETNRVFQMSQPWKETDPKRLKETLWITYESIRIVSILIQPILPKMSNFCLDRLGVGLEERSLENARIGAFEGGHLGQDRGVFIERILK